MGELRYTLVADGTSDRRLLPLLTWLVQQHSRLFVTATWADFTRLRPPPRALPERIGAALEYYPCDLLFVHRDAEVEPREKRLAEIDLAARPHAGQPLVPVVPVRMQEAWLLIDESAIRTAAGRPNGRVPLNLPPLRSIEALSDPKTILYSALQTASEAAGRSRRKFNPAAAAYRVSELIEDYSPLRGLAAFDALEADLMATLRRYGLA
jgi:hypothetical protein